MATNPNQSNQFDQDIDPLYCPACQSGFEHCFGASECDCDCDCEKISREYFQ